MRRFIAIFLNAALLFSVVFTLDVCASEPYQGMDAELEEKELEESDSYVYKATDDEAVAANAVELNVKAKSAVLMEAGTGILLYENNAHDKQSPASVTKIMTLLLVMEAIESGKITMDDMVATSEAAAEKGGSQIWLEVGEEMSVHDLLKAAAIGSANDASVALAEHVAGSEESFVVMMNDRAHELGMMDTNFENCTGLDDTAENHITSAYDVALMSCELLKYEEIYEFTTTWMDSLRDGKTELVNTNKLVRFYEGATGLKTGTTSKAGSCLSASAKRDGMHLVAVVLGSENSNDRFNSARSLLNWGFANYTVFTPEIDPGMITPISVTLGVDKTVTPVAEELSPILIKKGREQEIKLDYSFNTGIEAPVTKGQVLGRVIVSLDGEELGNICLISPSNIDRMTFGKAFVQLFEKIMGKRA